MTLRAILDTMIFDEIASDDALFRDVMDSISAGRLEILTTHIQEDQISKIPDKKKRTKILTIPRIVVPTGGAVWGVSKWDQAQWGDGIQLLKIEDVFRGNRRDIPDALIGVTLSNDNVLITKDKKFMSRVKEIAGDRVWSFEMFREFVLPSLR